MTASKYLYKASFLVFILTSARSLFAEEVLPVNQQGVVTISSNVPVGTTLPILFARQSFDGSLSAFELQNLKGGYQARVVQQGMKSLVVWYIANGKEKKLWLEANQVAIDKEPTFAEGTQFYFVWEDADLNLYQTSVPKVIVRGSAVPVSPPETTETMSPLTPLSQFAQQGAFHIDAPKNSDVSFESEMQLSDGTTLKLDRTDLPAGASILLVRPGAVNLVVRFKTNGFGDSSFVRAKQFLNGEKVTLEDVHNTQFFLDRNNAMKFYVAWWQDGKVNSAPAAIGEVPPAAPPTASHTEYTPPVLTGYAAPPQRWLESPNPTPSNFGRGVIGGVYVPYSGNSGGKRDSTSVPAR